MRVINRISTLQTLIKKLKRKQRSIGFVPTMGALHEGHASLIRKCRTENDIVVLSIFVNPKQFGPAEDFSRYPRPEKKDKLLAKKESVDIIFYPTEKEMYPSGFLTKIEVGGLGSVLCGSSRPHHFQGVTTVVGKLLNIVNPDTLYLGQKDAQQAVMINKMIRDLNYPIKVKLCPTIRSADGLALSSRNSYLTDVQRKEAVVLYQSLQEAKQLIQSGERSSSVVLRRMQTKIRRHSSGTVDYVACVDADTLEPLSIIKGNVLMALAVRFGKTRLIDNFILKLK